MSGFAPGSSAKRRKSRPFRHYFATTSERDTALRVRVRIVPNPPIADFDPSHRVAMTQAASGVRRT